MAVAREAEHLFGRSVAWGAEAGGTTQVFTNLSIPVMTRLRQPERVVLDTLVDSGVARSRSDALLWCVKLVAANADEWLRDLRTAMESVETRAATGPLRGLSRPGGGGYRCGGDERHPAGLRAPVRRTGSQPHPRRPDGCGQRCCRWPSPGPPPLPRPASRRPGPPPTRGAWTVYHGDPAGSGVARPCRRSTPAPGRGPRRHWTASSTVSRWWTGAGSTWPPRTTPCTPCRPPPGPSSGPTTWPGRCRRLRCPAGTSSPRWGSPAPRSSMRPGASSSLWPTN